MPWYLYSIRILNLCVLRLFSIPLNYSSRSELLSPANDYELWGHAAAAAAASVLPFWTLTGQLSGLCPPHGRAVGVGQAVCRVGVGAALQQERRAKIIIVSRENLSQSNIWGLIWKYCTILSRDGHKKTFLTCATRNNALGIPRKRNKF